MMDEFRYPPSGSQIVLDRLLQKVVLVPVRADQDAEFFESEPLVQVGERMQVFNADQRLDASGTLQQVLEFGAQRTRRIRPKK